MYSNCYALIAFYTMKPQIVYQGVEIPIKEINLYTKIISILKSKNEINQITVSLENFSIKNIQKLATRIKPSNFKTSYNFCIPRTTWNNGCVIDYRRICVIRCLWLLIL